MCSEGSDPSCGAKVGRESRDAQPHSRVRMMANSCMWKRLPGADLVLGTYSYSDGYSIDSTEAATRHKHRGSLNHESTTLIMQGRRGRLSAT